jgi:hypothetical protein
MSLLGTDSIRLIFLVLIPQSAAIYCHVCRYYLAGIKQRLLRIF